MKLTFGDTPVNIGMVHFKALPGSPYYAGETDQEILEAARADRDALLDAGFTALSFSNEGDRPYLTEAPRETVALMTWLVGELSRDLEVPFGCGVLIDPYATLAVARAVKASFVRVTFGVYAGVFGMEEQDPGQVLRYRDAIRASGVDILMNVSAHFGTSLDSREQTELTKSYVAMVQPAAVQVHGLGAGFAPRVADVAAIKDAVGSVPVLAASGTTVDNVAEFLSVCEGTIVGSSLKYDGVIWNAIDPARASAYMTNVRAAS